MEGHTVREVADHVGLSERSVKRVLSRVRQLAAEKLSEESMPDAINQSKDEE
jgi:DNA-directed RNA polymerase specialized sigma24 family protein